MAVDAARSDPPTPRAQACAHMAQRREQERVAHKREKRIRGVSAGSGETRSSGCASSMGSLPRRHQMIRHRRRRKKTTGDRLSRQVGAHAPVIGRRGDGKRAGARRQAVNNRGGTSRKCAGARRRGAHTRGGGVWGHGGGHASRARSARRALEEEEVRLLLPEVRNCPSRGRVTP
jgi:hypothetical protein